MPVSFRIQSIGCLQFLIVMAIAVGCWHGIAAAQVSSFPAEMEMTLRQRLARNPTSASDWRLLGRFYLAKEDHDQALQACRKAVELDPESASGHFDLGRVLLAVDRTEDAISEFQMVRLIAPSSDYGIRAEGELVRLGAPVPSAQPPVPSEDSRPDRFTGPEQEPGDLNSNRPLAIRLEVGALYNSNVQLAPLSRTVSGPGTGSAQGSLAPELEWRTWSSGSWSSGLLWRSLFTFNEGDLTAFDLQEYQPGYFVEKSWAGDADDWVARASYTYALDEFNGKSFASRHAVITSLRRFTTTQESVVLASVDQTNYWDDGSFPSISSQDGWTYTIGAQRTWYGDVDWRRWVRLGCDLQWAPLEGADYSYRGLFGYLATERPINECTTLACQFGYGYRQYPEFTMSPSRDENLYRARVELRRAIGPNWELVGMATYDRFATANESFDTQRFLGGVSAVFRY